MKIKFIFILSLLFNIQINCTFGNNTNKNNDDDIKEIKLKDADLLTISKDLISKNNIDDAEKILNAKPYNQLELEIERLYILAEIYNRKGNLKKSEEIYRYILNYQPNLTNIRLSLAKLYYKQENWYRADYHFRLALTDKTLPPEVKDNINTALYFIRQNKNWNLWFNFGLTPDNNINNGQTGKQCINSPWGILCNTLPPPERAIGLNSAIGLNYEYKLSDNLRLRNELSIQKNTYDKKQYNDLYLSYNFGPKYVYKKGETFLALTTNRRYAASKYYSYSIGAKLDTNYDITNKLNGSIGLAYSPTFFVEYGDSLNSNSYSINYSLNYNINAKRYILFKNGYDFDRPKDTKYSNNRINYAIGFGTLMPYGFSLYIEPSISHTFYNNENYFVKDFAYKKLKEKDLTERYSISISNNKIDFYGFTPNLSFTFTKKHSNIWQKEYKKSSIEFNMKQSV